MKTVKDLKIGDTVWFINGTALNTSQVKTLSGQYAITFENGSLDPPSKVKYADICENTTVKPYYDSYMVYVNQSEAIMEVKKRLCDAMDAQVKVVEAEMQKLLTIKNDIAKYL